MTGRGSDRCDESRAGAVLYAKDMDRVAAFYAAVVDLTPAARHEDYALLESPADFFSNTKLALNRPAR